MRREALRRVVALLEGESKLSVFSNFIEHFPRLAAAVNWPDNQQAELYLRLVNVTQPHAA